MLFFHSNSDPSYRNSEEMHSTVSFTWYFCSPLPTFYVEFTDSAKWAWSGKNGQVQHLKLPYALEETNREKMTRTFEQCGFLNVTGFYVAKPHTLSSHFTEWQEMTTGCTLQFNPNPVERRIPKQRICWRTFPSEQVSSSSVQGQQKTKVPIFPYST